jgi:hypothetical protein
MSITRRAVLQGAIVGACTLRGWAAAQRPRLPRRVQLDHVIFDARRSRALAFAETAQRLGASTHATYGDVHDSWFQHLRGRWNTRRTPVAGLTDFRSLFLLQTMAADAGLHPVLRIHHRKRDESDDHEAFGAQAYQDLSEARLANCGENWAHEAARLVLSLPEAAANALPHDGNLVEADLRTLSSTELVTWVIA